MSDTTFISTNDFEVGDSVLLVNNLDSKYGRQTVGKVVEPHIEYRSFVYVKWPGIKNDLSYHPHQLKKADFWWKA